MAPVGLDESLGDGQAQTGPAAAAVLAEHLEDALAILGFDSRTVVVHRDLHLRHTRGRCGATRHRPSAHADDAAPRGEPPCVLEHVGQHLADKDVVEVQERQVVRCLRDDAVRCDEAAQRTEGLRDELVKGDDTGPQFQGARLDAGHVEQVGDESGQAVRLQLNQLQQLGPVLRRQPRVGLAQTGHGRLDGSQRGA